MSAAANAKIAGMPPNNRQCIACGSVAGNWINRMVFNGFQEADVRRRWRLSMTVTTADCNLITDSWMCTWAATTEWLEVFIDRANVKDFLRCHGCWPCRLRFTVRYKLVVISFLLVFDQRPSSPFFTPSLFSPPTQCSHLPFHMSLTCEGRLVV